MSTATAVNVPEVQLPRLHPDCHRLLHFHMNTPGVLADLSGRVERFGLNVVSQYLQTFGEYAYCILDVESPFGKDKAKDEELRASLQEVRGTIRVRTLW